jgi:hypothetical protein
MVQIMLVYGAGQKSFFTGGEENLARSIADKRKAEYGNVQLIKYGPEGATFLRAKPVEVAKPKPQPVEDALTYKELQAEAKRLKVKATGKYEDILARVEAAQRLAVAVTGLEPAPAKKTRRKAVNKAERNLFADVV